MIRFISLFAGCLGLAAPMLAFAAPVGDCSSETTLSARGDVVFCEPWESANWWQNGYLKVASTTRPTAAASADVANATVVSSGCISGSCLRVDMKQYQSGALAIHWPLKNAGGIAPDELHLRYYLKLGENFDPRLCSSTDSSAGTGGKFPGLADVRAYPEEQCGNGGAFSDGLSCWSARAGYRNCQSSTSQDGPQGSDICTADSDGKQATTRFGHYFYLPGGQGGNETSQAMALWDNRATGTASYGSDDCLTNPQSLGNWGTNKCGIGAGGLVNGRWYVVEQHIKMNTPGRADGVVEGWIDGVLKWRKTNMVFRLVGHDNLHVRTIWLNVHAGGEFVGPCSSTYVMLDQMAAATGGRLGAVGGQGVDTTPPAPPAGLRMR